MKKHILLALAIGGLVEPVLALNWVSKPTSVQTGQTYTVSATHTFSGGGGVAAGSIYIYKNGAFFAGNGNGGNSFTMSTSASTSDAQAGTITYTSTATVTPQGWGSGPMTYNISGTVQVQSPNIAPTVAWHTLPGTMYPNTWYAARATGSDENGNLGGVWVEFRVNGGSWQALAYDPVGANGGNGSATTTNNNGVTTGGAGTTYQFRCYAWDQAGANSGWKESGVFTVVKRSQSSLTLGASASQVFGTSQTLSVSGGSGSGAVTYAIVGQSASGVATLSGATLTANTGTGWVDVQATKASDSDYNSKASNTVRVTFAKAGQAISFSNPGNRTYGGSAFGLGATASSGLGVSYSVSGPATLSGSTLTLSGVGSVTVTASQGGDANWNAAPIVTHTFSVEPQPVSFSFSGTSYTFSGSAKAPTISNPSGATYSVSGTSSATNAGNYSFTVTATGNYTGSATCNWSIAKAGQAALTFAPSTTMAYGSAQTLSATGGSGGGGISYAITSWSQPNVATLSGATLTANTGTGWVEVQATRAADANYDARSSAVVRVDFTKAAQTITFNNPGNKTYGDVSFNLGATASSGLTVSYSVSGPATLSGSTLTLTGAGSVTVTASQAGNTDWSAAANEERTFTVHPKPVSFSFSNTSHTYSGDMKAPTINNPGGATYTTSGTLSATNAGSYSFSVTANGNYTGVSTCNWTIARKPVNFAFSDTILEWSGSYDENGNPHGDTKGPTIINQQQATYEVVLDPNDVHSARWANVGRAYYFYVTATGNFVDQYGPAICNWMIRCCPAQIEVDEATLTQTYNGQPKQIGVTTSPRDLEVRFSHRSQTTPGVFGGSPVDGMPANAGKYLINISVYDSTPEDETGGYGGQATAILTINKAQQDPLELHPARTSQTYGTTQRLELNGGSGNGAVTYEFTSAVPSSLAEIIPLPALEAADLKANSGSGSVQVRVRRGEGDNYLEAVSAPVTISFTRAEQAELIFTPVSPLVFDSIQDLSEPAITSGGSGSGVVTYEVLENVPDTTPDRVALSGTPATVLKATSGTGIVVIRATKASDDDFNATSTEAIVELGKAEASVVLLKLIHVYDGTEKTASAATMPSGLSTTISYGEGNRTDVGDYAVSAAIAESELDYTGSAEGALVIQPAPQTVSVSATPSSVAFGQSITFEAHGGHNGYVWGEAASGSGSSVIITPTLAGTATATVYSPEGGNYQQSNIANVEVLVTRVIPVGTFAGKTVDGPYTLTSGDLQATFAHPSNTAMPVPTGTVTYDFTPGTVLNAGIHTITASYPGDNNYAPATVTATFVVNKTTPEIIWNPMSLRYGETYGENQRGAVAKVGSQTILGTFTYAPAPGSVATTIGSKELTVHFTPSDSANYNAAVAARTITIGKGVQTITFANPGDKRYGEFVVLTATSNSGLPIGYSVSGQAQAITALSNGTGKALRTNGIGTVTVTAQQSGNEYYDPAPPVTHQFNVAKALHTITFPDPATTGYALLASSSAGIPVTYSLSDGTGGWVIRDVVPIDPNLPSFKQLAFTGYLPNKTVQVIATAGDEFHETVTVTSPMFSSSGPESFWITRPADTVVAAEGYHLSFYAHHPATTDNSQNTYLKMYARRSDASTWTELGQGYFNEHGIVNTGVFIATAGTWEIKVVNGPDANSAEYSNHRLTITAINGQVINFPDPGPRKVNEVFNLGASTTAVGLPISYHVIAATPGSVEFVTSSSIRVTQPGPVTIEARQGGGSGYAPALSVRRTFTVVAPPRLVIEQPLTYSTATGILSAEGWALDYEDGAPIAVTLVIDGQPQGPQVVQRKDRSDIAAQAVAGNWSLKSVLNCGWEIDFPVASLAEGSHTVFVRATDGSEQSVELGHTDFTGGTPQQRSETITFPDIGPRSFGEQFMLNASAASGRLVTYTVDSGGHLITLEGNRVTVKNTAGSVTIRASTPSEGGYPPASVVRTFSIAHGDEDGDGVPEWWEQAYGINASPGSDANNDGVKDIDEYHLWRNPKQVGGGAPKDAVKTNLNVTAKGSGTVTLTVDGTPRVFTFAGAAGEWLEPDPFGTTYAMVRAKLGEETEVPVSWSAGITDFIVKAAKSPVPASELRSRVELSASGSGTPIQFADAISKAEIVAANGSNKIKVRAMTEGSVPFGVMDTSKLEVQRRLRFGLGGTRTGDSAGMIVYSSDNYVIGGGIMNFAIIKGPAMTDVREHVSDPKRFQAKVPAGYVDVYRLRDLITIRFYPNGSYPEDGYFKNFSGATPLVGYDLAGGLMAKTGSITQTAGGNSLVLEFENERSVLEKRTNHPDGGYTLKKDYIATFKHWGWRLPEAPREGLTTVKTETFQTTMVGSDNNPGQPSKQPILVKIYRHQGTTTADGVLAQEEHQFGAGDTELLYGATAVLRGSAAEQQLVSHRFTKSSSIDLNPPTTEVNSTGGETKTEYFTSTSVINGGSNFGTQPSFVAGERKTVKRGFLDGTPDDTNAIVTNYTYKTYLVDGRAAPATAITTQGSAPLGNIVYDYPAAATGQVITKTSVKPASGAAVLDTTLRAYSRRLADLDLRDKPIAITRPDTTKTVYSYRVSGEDLIVTELNGKTGSGVTSFAGTTLAEALDMDANRSTAIERTFDKHGRLKREESYVFQGGTAFTSLGAVDHTYDTLGNLTAKTHSSGRVLYQASYTGFRKDWEVDEQGIRLDYVYDNYNRVWTMTRASATDGANVIAATTTTYEYDQAGRLVKETVSAAGTTETLVSSYTYDTANRPKTRTLPGNFKTTITYDSATKTTTTMPDGGTKIEEVHKDGRVKSVTGTAVPDTTTSYAYDATSGNLKTTQTTAGQWATTETDWAGRTVSVSTPTFAGTTRVVSSTYTGALLTKQETKVGSTAIALPRIFEYDGSGYARLVREGLDANGNGILEPATDYDVKEYDVSFQTGAPNYPTNLYRYEGVKIWPHDGANASTSRFASQTYTQVTGFGSTTIAHAVSRDFDQNITDSTTTVDRTSKKVTVSTTTTGTTATLQQVTLNGLPIKSVNAQGHVTLQTYDALGRVQATNDPRTGTTDHEYHANTTLLKLTTAPDFRTTQYAYDTAGRVKSQTNPDGKMTYFQYDAAGNLTHQWGDTVNPVKYIYNDLGQKTEMHTYRSGTWTGATLPSGFGSDGDKTTWSYQGTTGLLLSKKDAVNATTSFEYTDLGQVMKRTDARGWITLYEYTDPRKLLTKVDYTGTAETYTTDVVYSYDRAGRTSTVTDALGARTFAYYDEATGAGTLDASARLKSETLPATFGSHALTYTYQYGVASRANGALAGVKIGTGTLYNVTYGYDSVLRPNSVAYNTTTAFGYTYVANSNLIDQVTQGASGYLRDYDYLFDSNRLDKLKHAWGSDTAKKVETIVSYNSLGLRNTEKTSGSDYMSTLGRGNETGVHTDYTYTDRMELDDSGKYTLLAGGSVGGLRSGSARDYDYDAIGNRTADHVGSYAPNALNQYTTAPGFGAFSYDANGNLKADGVRSYDYDAENRLIKVTQGAVVWNYKYDYLGRRIEKSGPSGTTRFLYDGWNLIAELNGSNTIQRRFAWGLDVSGSLQGAGGVGGLLVIDDGVARRYPIYDASHNVIALYTSTGTLAAAYEYDPFGNTSTSLGSYAAQNPFRYSTKYTDAETNFVYYGHRYYVPALGRFLNRDPIEEEGGINLYGFCGNDGVNYYDYLGLDSQSDNKSFAEEAERAAREAAMDRARGEIIAKYGITGLAFGEGGSDRDVINAYVDGYNGFVDNFNASVQSRGGADGNFGKSPFGGVSEVGSAELRANGAVANGAAVGLTQEQRNLAKTATVTLGDLVSLGTVGDDAISARTPSSRRGIDYNSISADAYGRAWDLNRGSGADPWGAVVGGFGQYSNALNTGALLEIAAPIAAVAPVAIVEFVVPTAIVVAKNIHIDGPKLKPNPLHGGVPTGRVAQVRVGTTPVFRIDYTDLPDYKASPILHAHIWPIMSRHIPLQRKKGP